MMITHLSHLLNVEKAGFGSIPVLCQLCLYLSSPMPSRAALSCVAQEMGMVALSLQDFLGLGEVF